MSHVGSRLALHSRKALDALGDKLPENAVLLACDSV